MSERKPIQLLWSFVFLSLKFVPTMQDLIFIVQTLLMSGWFTLYLFHRENYENKLIVL